MAELTNLPPQLKRRRFLQFLAPGFLAAAGGSYPFSRAFAAPTRGIVGLKAPDLQVDYWIDGSGRRMRLDMAELDGKWVFLKCFQNWCPGCHRHGFPTLKKVSEYFAEDDRIAVLGLQTVFEGFSINTRSSVRELQLRYALKIPMGHDAGDPSGDHRPVTMRQYRTGGTPWIVVIAPDKTVVFNDFDIDSERFIAFMESRLG